MPASRTNVFELHDFASKGVNQAVNQGVNSNEKVNTLVNNNRNKDLTVFVDWLSVKEAVNLLGISKVAFHKKRKKEKYATRQVLGNGGLQYEVRLSSLPVLAQKKWLEKHGISELGEHDKACNEGVKSFDEMPEQAAEKARLRYDVIKLYEEAVSGAGHGQKLAAKEAFVERFNSGEWPHLLEKIGTVAWKTIDTHWIPKLRESGGRPSSLAPQYHYSRDGARRISTTALARQLALEEYMKPSQLKVAEVIRRVNGRLAEMGRVVESEWKIRAFLKEYMKENGALVTMCRKGEKEYNDHCAPYIESNPDKIEFGDMFEADGHVINFRAADPLRDIERRMTMIMHTDRRTKAILGWEIMPSENVQAIAASLRRAMLWAGFLVTGDEDSAFVPRVMKVDNGKAFKARFFDSLKGDTICQTGIGGLFDELLPFGFVRVSYATPYRGQSKTIERIFGNFAELERSIESYTGTSITMRPALERRGEFLHREVAAMMKHRSAISIEEAHLAVALWVHQYNNTPAKQSRYLKGRTPYEALEESVLRLREQGDLSGRIVPGGHLKWMMMREEQRRLTRNGLSLFGRQYLSPELHDLAKGERNLLVRFDLDRMGSVLVYHPNGEFLCEAPEWNRDGGIHPAATILGTEADREAFRKARAFQTDLHKSTAQEAKRSLVDAANAGYGPFLSREVVPDVKRLVEKGEAKRTEKRRRTGSDDMEIPAEWVIPEPEEKRRDGDDLPHYLDCQNEGY